MRNLILGIFAIFILGGCGANMVARLDNVRAGYVATDYAGAAINFAGDTDFQSMDNLELLITADALFHNDDFLASDTAYEEFNQRNIELTDGDIMREATTLLAGNMANDYRPYMMDALFVSYYQLWDALAMGNMGDARVIINQSYARQQKMSREYADLISEIQNQSVDNPALAVQLQNENAQWGAFSDIMNPALTYLAGIYFLNMGDFDNAKTYLRRANGMMPDNKYIERDLRDADAGRIPTDTVWVFVEDGFAPKLVEERMDMPVSIGNSTSILSLALSRPIFLPNIVSIDDAEIVADVDAMFMTEYGQYRINEAIRAMASATARVAMQSAFYNSSNDYMPLVGLFTTAYSMASTNAEVRTWATLPKTISVLRVARDKSGLIELKSGGNVIAQIPVQGDGNWMVYIRTGANAYDVKPIRIK